MTEFGSEGASAAGGGAFLASSALLSLPDPETSDSTPNTIAPARAAPTTIFLLSHWTVLSEGMRFGRSAAGVRSISFTSGVASTSNLLSDTSVLRRSLASFRRRIRLGIATVDARAFVVDAQHHLPPAQEIGSASCWEREVPYVCIMVMADSLQKTKNND